MATKTEKKPAKTEVKSTPSAEKKQSIHPNYREIRVLFTNNEEVTMRSACLLYTSRCV